MINGKDTVAFSIKNTGVNFHDLLKNKGKKERKEISINQASKGS